MFLRKTYIRDFTQSPSLDGLFSSNVWTEQRELNEPSHLSLYLHICKNEEWGVLRNCIALRNGLVRKQDPLEHS